MEPILKSYFNRFKQSFDINTIDSNSTRQAIKESGAFEKFINYTLFSIDDPEAFVGNTELLDVVCVGGGYDTGIDGIGIRINGRLMATIDDVQQMVELSKKIEVEFIFIQSKMQEHFDSAEFNVAGVGVKNFFSNNPKLPFNGAVEEFRKIKEYIYTDDKLISKLRKNPSVSFFYVAMGNPPHDEHFEGVKKLIQEELQNDTGNHFDNVKVEVVGGKQILEFCKELENSFSVKLNTNDIIPLTVPDNDKIKKAYIFTCYANEFLKILTKEDGTIRRSLFNDNVRDYLGDKGSVNREIQDTIATAPELFSICNNGVTIVCTDFEQIRDKLIKIENPQIVNGCQTSNTLFNNKNIGGFEKIQIIVRIICTEDAEISNRVVRGTNKQNQVLDEAFEATKVFHQNLEDYFNAIQDGMVRLYYERRSKQYSYNPLIKKYQIVNLRIITQTFVAVFLERPDVAHHHEAKLLEEYCKNPRRIYNDNHELMPYYLCATIWYLFENAFRRELLEKKYKTYKAHLYLIFRYSTGDTPSGLQNKKQINKFCEKVMSRIKSPNINNILQDCVDLFESIKTKWIKEGGSKYGIKDSKHFTDILIDECEKKYLNKSSKSSNKDSFLEYEEGTIFSLKYNSTDRWFAFIKPLDDGDNIYFDSRNFNDDIRKITFGRKVMFIRKQRFEKECTKVYADNVQLI